MASHPMIRTRTRKANGVEVEFRFPDGATVYQHGAVLGTLVKRERKAGRGWMPEGSPRGTALLPIDDAIVALPGYQTSEVSE